MGQRTFDEQAWEAAIQQVLAACKEFDVACGYPASANDIELRMKQVIAKDVDAGLSQVIR